ncbi:MAG TPA: hypothetical protein VGI47_12130 [Candidatus Binataceae bacterium]
MISLAKKVSLFFLAATLIGPVCSLADQVPQPANGNTDWSGVGYGAGSAVTSIVYFPFKMAYAIAGGIVGAGAYAATAGNSQVANTIWRSSMGGDYVITPDVLKGKEQLHFTGPTTTAGDGSASAAPIAASGNATGTPPASGAQPMYSGGTTSHASAPADHSIE